MKKATLISYNIEKDRLFFLADVMGREFATSIWYKDVDFHELRDKIGKQNLERIVAHIAAFELNKYGSLHLRHVDLGELSKYVDESFAQLWENIFVNIWGQWRYENNLPHDKAPELIRGSSQRHQPTTLPHNHHATLTFFGGGKDSFVSSSILQGSGVNFDILEYSNSIYGNRAEQSDVSEIAGQSAPKAHVNEIAVYDDFLDSPIIQYDSEAYHIHSLAAAETPASVFECLPLALFKGYNALALGHEKSANYPNLLWDLESMTPINHQWGKSLEAQKAIANYIKSELVKDISYFSTLMPLSDPAIFTIFAEMPWELVSTAHSCNVVKPWCRRCAKCVYVWLFYLAFLDKDKVTNDIFGGEVLFGIEDNYDVLRKLAGLESQTPFECVGQPPESRLAIAICKSKGYNQPILDELLANTTKEELLDTVMQQLTIDEHFLEQCEIPAKIASYYKHDLTDLLGKKQKQLLARIAVTKL